MNSPPLRLKVKLPVSLGNGREFWTCVGKEIESVKDFVCKVVEKYHRKDSVVDLLENVWEIRLEGCVVPFNEPIEIIRDGDSVEIVKINRRKRKKPTGGNCERMKMKMKMKREVSLR